MTALNIVQITVNNQAVAIKPNSCSFTAGRGERTVRTKMSGRNLSTVASEDVETQTSMIKFTLLTETDTTDLVTSWQDNGDANGIVMQDVDGNTYTFNKAIITNDPEINSGVDAETEVEFTSSPLVKG